MARLNTYPRTSQPSDSDVFIIDSTTGSAGTRTVLWSSIKALFAATKHSHSTSDITSGTMAVDRLPTIPLAKGGTGATSAEQARMALGVQNPITSPDTLTNQNLNSYNTLQQCGWYYAEVGNSVTNKPSGVDYFGVFVMQTASSIFTQILYDNSNKIWTRSYSNSSWSSWTALVRTTDTIAKATSATSDSSGQIINTTYVKSVTASGRTVTVTKGNGTTSQFTTQDTTYSEATQSAAGLMSADDKTKLDRLSGDYISAIRMATSSKDGLMSKTDKAKLDKLPSDGMTPISNSTIDSMF